MSAPSTTQVLPAIVWHDPRIHLLDDAWLVTIFAILFASALPWLISGMAIDFFPVAAGLLALGALHVAFSAMSARSGVPRGIGALATLHAAGVVAIGFIWQHAGGLQNPLFLAVFALPVIGSIFLSRWQPYVMAALAAIVVALVAAIQAPELRWYAPGLNAALDWVQTLLGRSPGGGLPFAGFYAPSEYFVVLLEVFVIVLFACAIAAEYLGTIFERLHVQVAAARAEAERGQELWSALLERLPLPAFLLDANSCEVISASAAALEKLGAEADSVVGRDFMETVSFSYPEMVQELIGGSGGSSSACVIRLGGQLLAAEVRVQHVAQKGRRFALVTLTDVTEAFCVKAALDVAEHAALVIDADGRVLAFNKPAGALFSGTRIGADLSRLVPGSDPGARWWDPGLSGRRKMHLTIAQRVYQVTTSAVVLPGEEARLHVVAFLPVALAAAAEQTGNGFTTQVRRP
jgi:PAS domain-containing protein